MQLVNSRATIAACVAVLLAGGNAAFARTSHHHDRNVAHRSVHHHGRHHARDRHARAVRAIAQGQAVNPYYSGPGAAKDYAFTDGSADRLVRARQSDRGRRLTARVQRRRAVRDGAASYASAGFSGFGGSSLVADARRYLGTNPTDRRSLWCGAFMDKILRDTGHRGGGDLAKGYLNYGTRVSGPQVGAIAVMGRRGGGHVGVVSGVDAHGNPIIISGNHNNTVAESTYPRGRILAYVMPGS
jgi:uncharacterized protein (TIGR02594 family)